MRSNKDGEYYGRYMGSRQKHDPFETMFGTPQSNDGAEKQNRTLLDMVRSMNSNFNPPLSLWSETLKNYCVYLNRVRNNAVPKTLLVMKQLKI